MRVSSWVSTHLFSAPSPYGYGLLPPRSQFGITHLAVRRGARVPRARHARGRWWSSGPGAEVARFSSHSLGTRFVEVRVDPDTCEVAVTGIVTTQAAGTILKPRDGSQPGAWRHHADPRRRARRRRRPDRRQGDRGGRD